MRQNNYVGPSKNGPSTPLLSTPLPVAGQPVPGMNALAWVLLIASSNSMSMRRVLIVEDETEALATLLAWMQTQRGVEVRCAQSGKAALELSKSFKPEVLISDYLLQDDISGVEVIAQVKARGMDVCCVLVTGMLRKALRDVERIAGVPILTKPIDFRRLGELIRPTS
ncbi:MAG: response regulator [Deltaproteobacteria bacterium]